jgi:hypothetical protein
VLYAQDSLLQTSISAEHAKGVENKVKSDIPLGAVVRHAHKCSVGGKKQNALTENIFGAHFAESAKLVVAVEQGHASDQRHHNHVGRVVLGLKTHSSFSRVLCIHLNGRESAGNLAPIVALQNMC